MKRFRPQTTGSRDTDRVIRQIVDEFNKGGLVSPPASGRTVQSPGADRGISSFTKRSVFSYSEFTAEGSSRVLMTIQAANVLEGIYIIVDNTFSSGSFISLSDGTALLNEDDSDLTSPNLYALTKMKYYSQTSSVVLTMKGSPISGSGSVLLKISKAL